MVSCGSCLTYRAAMQIRTATDGDWSSIFPFFDAIVQAGETYAYPLDLDDESARLVWMEPPPGHVVVATDDTGRIIGSAKMGPNRPGRGAHIATASFMVDPSAQTRGTGRALARYMIDWARAQSFHGVQFNAVVESNAAAVHLWTSLGFEIIGTVPEAFDHRRDGRVGLHVMYLAL